MDISNIWQKIQHTIFSRAPSILLALIVLILGWWLIRLLSRYISNRIQNPHVDPSIKPFFLGLLVTGFRIILILTALQIAGFKMTIFTVLLGSLGVAAGLALSGTLQNFASGTLILLLKPFKSGDKIIAQGKEGIISSVQMFYTIMLSDDNSLTIIPNSKLSNEIIINSTACRFRKLEVKLKYAYTTELADIKSYIDIAINKLQEKKPASLPGKTNDVQQSFKRKIGISTLEPDGYTIVIDIWIPSENFKFYQFNFSEKLLATLKEAVKLPGT